MSIGEALEPNRVVGPNTRRAYVIFWFCAALLLWIFSPFQVLPKPGEVFSALGTLWANDGLGPELLASLWLNVEALLISTVISLGLAYLTVLPLMRPLVAALTRGRFLSLIGFSFVFTLLFGGGHTLEVSLLVFGMTVFYLTSMASVIASIPKEEFDHARTLRFSEWRVVWEVVVLGTIDQAFEVMRQNAAMGWMMLTMVEGIYRAGGGIGVMLIDNDKHFRLEDVFAIQVVFLLVGLFQDTVISMIRSTVCPYADLTLERK
jgi:NitT/TauT family transport system permease protein